MDSQEEVKFRLGIAEVHLKNAKKQLELYTQEGEGRYLAGCIGDAQACIEISAKAIISCFKIPSKSHNPALELLETIEEAGEKIPREIAQKLHKVAKWSSEVAPEHGRVIYGDESRRIPPDRLYSQQAAAEFLNKAEKSYTIASNFFQFWYSGIEK